MRALKVLVLVAVGSLAAAQQPQRLRGSHRKQATKEGSHRRGHHVEHRGMTDSQKADSSKFSTATHAAKKSIRNVVDAAATAPEHDVALEDEAAWMGDMPVTVETEEEVVGLLNQWKTAEAAASIAANKQMTQQELDGDLWEPEPAAVEVQEDAKDAEAAVEGDAPATVETEEEVREQEGRSIPLVNAEPVMREDEEEEEEEEVDSKEGMKEREQVLALLDILDEEARVQSQGMREEEDLGVRSFEQVFGEEGEEADVVIFEAPLTQDQQEQLDGGLEALSSDAEEESSELGLKEFEAFFGKQKQAQAQAEEPEDSFEEELQQSMGPHEEALLKQLEQDMDSEDILVGPQIEEEKEAQAQVEEALSSEEPEAEGRQEKQEIMWEPLTQDAEAEAEWVNEGEEAQAPEVVFGDAEAALDA